MKGFAPGLLDRLMGEPTAGALSGSVARLTIDELKDGVARDLEALLNTRVATRPETFDGYPEARASILNYGLVDFAGFCLSSSDDRATICANIKSAIERHERRLTNVTASLEVEAGSVNRLNFVINAVLEVHPAIEPVHFNAVLQPSSQHYSISKATRSARPINQRQGTSEHVPGPTPT